MARDYKRLTRRARHLIRRLRRTKHAAVQRVTVHELTNEIHRRRFGRAPRTAAPDLGKAGHWRPLSYRAKKLLTQLRKTKVWSVQRRLVKELAEEIERKRLTLAERFRKARERWRRRGKGFRAAARRGQERLLTRAERRQLARQGRQRKPPGRFLAWLMRHTPLGRLRRRPDPAPAARTRPGGRLAPSPVHNGYGRTPPPRARTTAATRTRAR